ncbi:MAG TPA: HAD family phosphatase [Bacillota bacterium]|nr:HAD family phosphatase [Bacillota bacterium]
MYKLVIFDFFGVFCASIASSWFKQNVPDYAAKLPAFQALCTQSDLGKLTRSDFNEALSKLTGIPAAAIAQGIEARVAINTALVDYAQQLQVSGLRIACLSNGSREWTLQVINEHNLGHLFEQVILSSDLGLVKPDREIYLEALHKLGAQPSQTIFVDDRKTNVDAAEALGIRGLVFTDTPTFIADLERILKG